MYNVDMDIHKKDQGKMGEALVTSQILEHGCAVFTEYGDNSKIDLIVEDSNRQLHKVQVKTCGREKNTKGVTKVYSYKSGPNYHFKYNEQMVDWFAVIDTETKKIAWLNIQTVVAQGQLTLRHDPPKKGGRLLERINMFDDYMVFPFN